jgi:hypothetical protein
MKTIVLVSAFALVATGAWAAPIGTSSKGTKHTIQTAVDDLHHGTAPVMVSGKANAVPVPRLRPEPLVTDPDPQVRHQLLINQSTQ